MECGILKIGMSTDIENLGKRRRKSKRSETPEILDEDEDLQEEPSFSLAALGLQPIGTVPKPKPRTQPTQPPTILNARGIPARIRKKNRLFFDENIINDDKPLRMSLSPRKLPASKVHQQNDLRKTLKTRGRAIKKRKSGLPLRYQQQHLEEKEKKPKIAMFGTSKDKTANNQNSSSGKSSATSSSSVGPSHATASAKKMGQRIGMRLRNLLKLPKAHKWVIYEWFYSFIDSPLFETENDFQICLREACPRLETRELARPEWQHIRKLLGKPRRCSQAFFDEERRELEKKRHMIRYLQTRRCGDLKGINSIRDLPEMIPLSLPVGTKVTARLRSPQDGIFTGVVDAFNSLGSSYRITFDRPGLGTHNIPDFEVLSENFNEMLPLNTIAKDFRGTGSNVLTGSSFFRYGTGGVRNLRSVLSSHNHNLNKSDPLLGQKHIESPLKDSVLNHEKINGYPTKLLERLARLKRALTLKKLKLQRLGDMNNEAELIKTQTLIVESSSNKSCEPKRIQPLLSDEFQRRYASIVITMEKLNIDVQHYLNEVQTLAEDLTHDPQEQALLAPSYLREQCRKEAVEAVERNNLLGIHDKNALSFIKKLATVLKVAAKLGKESNTEQVSKVLEGCMEEVKTALHAENIDIFQQHVQLHLKHIRMGTASPNKSASNTNTTNDDDTLENNKSDKTIVNNNNDDDNKDEESDHDHEINEINADEEIEENMDVDNEDAEENMDEENDDNVEEDDNEEILDEDNEDFVDEEEHVENNSNSSCDGAAASE